MEIYKIVVRYTIKSSSSYIVYHSYPSSSEKPRLQAPPSYTVNTGRYFLAPHSIDYMVKTFSLCASLKKLRQCYGYRMSFSTSK